MAGGYLSNPDASSDCGFCSTRTTDEWLGNLFNIYYSHHWRNIGLIIAFIGFNVCASISVNRSVANLFVDCIHLRFHLVL